ncbi:MAG TPA: TetR/AcrR family transcriptional regulator [Pseudonocardia sp.]|nr:TetR/AcrR family transcriptional regulator [Pseudonocardia sp.]
MTSTEPLGGGDRGSGHRHPAVRLAGSENGADGATRQPSARDALRRTAQRLFAVHGFDGVSVRQITRDAGQRNSTAVAYHFGSRDGLLRTVLEHHLDQVLLRHDALLERYRDAPPTAGPAGLLDLADALVMPLCAELDCADGGPEFLQVAAEVINRSDWIFAPGTPIALLIQRYARWSELVEPYLSVDGAGRLHRRFAAMRFVYVELGRRARQPLPRRDDRLFASQLADLVAALLTAPLSPRTSGLLRDRDRLG